MAKTTKKAPKTAAVKAANKPRTKSQIYTEIAEATGLAKRDVAAVFENMTEMIRKDLTRGPKIFTVPGLMKIKVAVKPATKARKGINPRTGEETMFKAKPARKVVRVRPLKALKDMVA